MFELFKKKKKVFQLERTLKSAIETREYAKKIYVSRNAVLDEIHEAAKECCSCVSFKGNLTEELKKELTEAGYKIEEYVSHMGYYCTEISWEC